MDCIKKLSFLGLRPKPLKDVADFRQPMKTYPIRLHFDEGRQQYCLHSERGTEYVPRPEDLGLRLDSLVKSQGPQLLDIRLTLTPECTARLGEPSVNALESRIGLLNSLYQRMDQLVSIAKKAVVRASLDAQRQEQDVLKILSQYE